jgi:hypothetical protein
MANRHVVTQNDLGAVLYLDAASGDYTYPNTSIRPESEEKVSLPIVLIPQPSLPGFASIDEI